MSAVDDESGRNVVAVGLCVVLAVAGVLLGLGGLKLFLLGGSAYFLCTGAACLAAAILLWLGHAGCLAAYGAMLAWTLAWSLWQVGLDFWGLAGRLGFLFLLGMAFWLPPVMRWLRLGAHADRALRFGTMALAVSLAGIVVAGVLRSQAGREPPVAPPSALAAAAPAVAGATDWPYYGNDAGGTHYAALASVQPGNVARLRVAWTYRTGEWEEGAEPRRLEVTPLKVGDSLYLCSARNVFIALDARTGRERWRHDPQGGAAISGAAAACRGVAFHAVPGADPAASCSARVYGATADARLLALDARTGAPCRGFGRDGAVDLRDGSGNARHAFYATSAPQVVRGRVVLGGWLSDGQSVGEPGGRVRAYDAVTGAYAWSVDPDEDAPSSQPSDPNAWAPISTDEALGLVFVPTGSVDAGATLPAGAARTHLYGAVVALDAASGRARWTFRAPRASQWDYDVASQPVLLDVAGPHGTVPAVLQLSKRGQVYLLDRRSGEPLGPPPGQPAAPAGDGPLREDDMWGLTPFDQLWCRLRLRQSEADATPATGPRPYLDLPALLGGVSWGGAALDPQRGVLVLNWARLPLYDPLASAAPAAGPQRSSVTPFLSPLGAPCAAPPYGHLAAVDLRAGKVLWQTRLGSAYDAVPLGLRSFVPIPLATGTAGGALLTASGLVFTVSAREQALRAVDLRSGDVLWQDRLPAGGQATPMAYQDAEGRPYVVIAAGGHPSMKTRPGDFLVAYTLP